MGSWKSCSCVMRMHVYAALYFRCPLNWQKKLKLTLLEDSVLGTYHTPWLYLKVSFIGTVGSVWSWVQVHIQEHWNISTDRLCFSFFILFFFNLFSFQLDSEDSLTGTCALLIVLRHWKWDPKFIWCLFFHIKMFRKMLASWNTRKANAR